MTEKNDGNDERGTIGQRLACPECVTIIAFETLLTREADALAADVNRRCQNVRSETAAAPTIISARRG